MPDVARFLQSKRGHSLINYGTSAGHLAEPSSGMRFVIVNGVVLVDDGAIVAPPFPEGRSCRAVSGVGG